jgi:hypothetical protein
MFDPITLNQRTAALSNRFNVGQVSDCAHVVEGQYRSRSGTEENWIAKARGRSASAMLYAGSKDLERVIGFTLRASYASQRPTICIFLLSRLPRKAPTNALERPRHPCLVI